MEEEKPALPGLYKERSKRMAADCFMLEQYLSTSGRELFIGKPGEENDTCKIYTYELEQENGYETEPLKQDIFEQGRDIFLGAYPVVEDQRGIMEREYITPHPSRFKNPNPISLLKVKPDVSFRFCFLLQDFVSDTGTVITAQDKLNLFREFLLLGGIGAKTNVGFGGLTTAK